jgi:hypothetical protein
VSDDLEVVDAGAVPDKITIRLDKESRRAIEAMMKASGLKLSSAIRLLITLGASRESKMDRAFKQAAWRDVTSQVYGRVQKHISQALELMLREAKGDEEGDA